MRESEFQTKVNRGLRAQYPDAHILKTDGPASGVQGFPDWAIVLPNATTVFYDAKVSANAKRQPNQDWYMDDLNSKGYLAMFVCPDNVDEFYKKVASYYERTLY
jgi:hypothetical protein